MKTERATIYPLSPQLTLVEFDRPAGGAWIVRGREQVVRLSSKEWANLRAVSAGDHNPTTTPDGRTP